MALILPSGNLSQSDSDIHSAVLHAGAASGTKLVCTDAHFDISVSEEKYNKFILGNYDKSNSVTAVNVALSLGVDLYTVINTIKFIRKNRGETLATNKDEVKYSVSTGLTALNTLGWLASVNWENSSGGTNPKYFEIRQLADTFLHTWGESEIKTIYETIDQRSLNMALNCQILQEILKRNPNLRSELVKDHPNKPLSLYFFAGSAHKRAEKDYQTGSKYTVSVLRVFANKTIDYTRQLIAVSPDEETETDRMNEWILLTSGYSYPIPEFCNLPEFKDLPPLDLPDSPRAILYKELLERIRTHPKDLILPQMLARLMKEDLDFMKFNFPQMTGMVEQVVNHPEGHTGNFTSDNKILLFFQGMPFVFSASGN